MGVIVVYKPTYISLGPILWISFNFLPSSSKHRDWDCLWSCLTWGLLTPSQKVFGALGLIFGHPKMVCFFRTCFFSPSSPLAWPMPWPATMAPYPRCSGQQSVSRWPPTNIRGLMQGPPVGSVCWFIFSPWIRFSVIVIFSYTDIYVVI